MHKKSTEIFSSEKERATNFRPLFYQNEKTRLSFSIYNSMSRLPEYKIQKDTQRKRTEIAAKIKKEITVLTNHVRSGCKRIK